MVALFLLHNASDMGIGGVSGKESSAVGEGRCSSTDAVRSGLTFWKDSWAVTVHGRVCGPPFWRSVKGCNT